MDKIKAFFASKTVRVIASILVVVGAVALLIGGIKLEDIKNIVVVTGAAFTAVCAVIALICSIVAPAAITKD